MCRLVALMIGGLCNVAALAGGLAWPAGAEEPVPAIPLATSYLVQAPAAEPPPERLMLERTKDVAREVAETTQQAAKNFQDSLAGKSLLVGVTRPEVTLKIRRPTVAKLNSDIETYKGTDELGYMVAVTSDAKQWDTVPLTETLSIGGSAHFAWNYGTFSLQQSQQVSAAGSTAGGKVGGDYMYFGLQMNYRLIWVNPVAPAAFGVFIVGGKGFARYLAQLDYSVGGRDYSIDVQNDGINPRQMFFGGFDLRWGQFFYRIDMLQIDGDSYATFGGRRLFVYSHKFLMRVETLGYAIQF